MTTYQLTAQIRWMIGRDVPACAAIDLAGFGEPWTEADFRDALADHGTIGLTAEAGGDIAGFVVYRLAGSRIDLIRLAVDPAFRRRDIGRQLANRVVQKLGSHRREKVVAVEDERNVGGLNFLKACGFRATRLIPAAFGDADGVRMVVKHRA